ncbi:Phage major capsid protein E [Paenibacillus phage phiERICV]|uniref:Phage major capsid protein E n=1 Tax=Paenibacillus larvae subsp. larvae TaxID=147375 RepID=A0A6C0QZI5_9BACL|nr:major capsid protein [Paenibacillus larvae]QHZ50024.1 Phage major capsid protein E [Paenibacillus larvae subsp. larvae]QHZ54109.1 Phage major capsid protein E [Paenibacillus phage phiERICV]
MPDIFDLRTLIAAIRQMPPAQTFLGDLLFGEGKPFNTETVEVEYRKGKRKMAPFVSPLLPGKVTNREGYTVTMFKPALVKPLRPVTVIDLQKKAFGQDPFADQSPDERAREIIAQDTLDLDEEITRREEWMRRELIFTGKVTQKGEGVDQVLDFGFTNKAVLSGTAVWSNPDSDPIAELMNRRLTIIQKSGITPDAVIMASDVASAFIKHPLIQKLLDNRNFSVGQVDPRTIPNGATYIGSLKLPALDIYSYDEWFLDDETGAEQPMVPTGTYAMVSTRGVFNMHYGAVTIMVNGEFATIRGTRVPNSWATVEPPQRFLQLNSRPLPIPTNVDSWYICKVLQ